MTLKYRFLFWKEHYTDKTLISQGVNSSRCSLFRCWSGHLSTHRVQLDTSRIYHSSNEMTTMRSSSHPSSLQPRIQGSGTEELPSHRIRPPLPTILPHQKEAEMSLRKMLLLQGWKIPRPNANHIIPPAAERVGGASKHHRSANKKPEEFWLWQLTLRRGTQCCQRVSGDRAWHHCFGQQGGPGQVTVLSFPPLSTPQGNLARFSQSQVGAAQLSREKDKLYFSVICCEEIAEQLGLLGERRFPITARRPSRA